MVELIATIDESGKRTLEYVCFIIGDSQSIKINSSKIPTTFTHMTNMPEKDKLPLLKSFDFNGNILVCCMHLGLLELKENVEQHIRKNNNNKDKKRFTTIIGHELEFQLRSVFDNFTRANNYDLKEIEFVIDNSLLGDYLKSAGFKIKLKTKAEALELSAHDVADCVAHANFKNWRFNDKIEEFIDNKFKPDFHDRIIGAIKHQI